VTQGWPPYPPPGYHPFPAPVPRVLPLDAAMARMRASDPRPWGVRPWLTPVVAYVVLIVAGSAVTSVVKPTSFAGKLALAIAVNTVLYALLAGAVGWAGRDIARRYGGWDAAFGWRAPSWRNLGWVAAGLGTVFAGEIAIGTLSIVLTGGKANEQSQNLHYDTRAVASAVLLVLTAVVIAPIVEETVFRGLLLRTFMSRMPFWPAAVLSSVVFAAGHTYEVHTLLGAGVLAATVGVLGMTNCVLVRLTDKLTPGMLVHASFNGLASGIAIYRAMH